MGHAITGILAVAVVVGLTANTRAQENATSADSSLAPSDSSVAAMDDVAPENEKPEAPGSRREQELATEEPWRQAWYVTADQLESVIQVDAVDLGLVVPAARVFDFGTVGQRSPFAFRGDAVAQGRVTLDDMVLSNPLTGATHTAVLPFNVVETVKYSGLGDSPGFGLAPAAGVLQVSTLNLTSEHPYSRVNFRVGDFGYSDLGITFGLPVSPSTRLLFSGSRQEFDTLFFGPLQSRTFERRDLVNSRFFGKIQYERGNRIQLQSVTLLNKNTVELPSPRPPDLIPVLSRPLTKNSRFDQQLSVRARMLSRLSQDLSARIHYSRLQQESFDDSLLSDNKVAGVAAEVENQTALGAHSLKVGAGVELSFLSSTVMADESDALWHIFAREHINLSDKFALALQGKLEKQNGYSAQIVSSVRFNYVKGPQTVFWLGAQSSTRYPTFLERFWSSPFYDGDSSLVPERIIGAEIGARLRPLAGVHLEATAYSSHTRDWIADVRFEDVDGIASFGARNFENRTVPGLDLKLLWDYRQGGQAGFVASFLSTDTNDPARLRVPEYSIYTYLEYGHDLFERYVFARLRLSGRFYGERTGYTYAQGASLPTLVLGRTTAVMDGKLTLVFKSATLNVSYENIFDRNYALLPGFTMPPRTLRFGVEWEFWD